MQKYCKKKTIKKLNKTNITSLLHVLLSKITQNGVNMFKKTGIYIFECRNVELLQKKNYSKTGLDKYNLTFTRAFMFLHKKSPHEYTESLLAKTQHI
jgi:hypothetical protein